MREASKVGLPSSAIRIDDEKVGEKRDPNVI